MPTYQYRCADCGEERDVVQSFSDDALTVCPVCEGRLRKVFSAVGVVFKGSGFYRTDSRNAAKASANGTSSNGSDGSSESGGSNGASESSSGSESSSKADGGSSSSSTPSSSSDSSKSSDSKTSSAKQTSAK